MDLVAAVETQRRRARLVVWLLAITALLDALAVLSGLMQRSLIAKASDGLALTQAEASANDARHSAVGIGQMVLYVVTGLAWLRWFHRTYGNLSLMGTGGSDQTAGWAIGYWLIPFANFFRPYQLSKELWIRSETRNDQPYTHREIAPVVLKAWWALWLLGIALERVGTSLTRGSPTLAQLHDATIMGILADGAAVASALLARSIVIRIDSFQRASVRQVALSTEGVPVT